MRDSLRLELKNVLIDLTSRQETAELLWQLLDDIDTATDACKNSSPTADTPFGRVLYTKFNERHKHIHSDGYLLKWPVGAMEHQTPRARVEEVTLRHEYLRAAPGEHLEVPDRLVSCDPVEPEVTESTKDGNKGRETRAPGEGER
jgi:hypothetical protein